MGTFVRERHGNSGISICSPLSIAPGRTGATKGLTFGLIGWMFMGLIFFPVIGLGPFAFGAGLGIAPALLSLAMLLTYSVVLGTVYAALNTSK